MQWWIHLNINFCNCTIISSGYFLISRRLGSGVMLILNFDIQPNCLLENWPHAPTVLNSACFPIFSLTLALKNNFNISQLDRWRYFNFLLILISLIISEFEHLLLVIHSSFVITVNSHHLRKLCSLKSLLTLNYWTIAPRRNVGLGSCEPLVTTFSSTVNLCLCVFLFEENLIS